MKKIPSFYYIIMTFILLIVLIFQNKYISMGNSLNVSITTFIYAFTFLLTAIIYHKYNSYGTKKVLIMSALSCLLFFIIISVLASISANPDSQTINQSLRSVLTPNAYLFYNIKIFYPDLIPLISLLAIFVLTHYIMIIVYDAIKFYSNYFIAFIIAILISYIIDVMLYVPINNIFNLLNTNITLIDIVKILTANFLVVVIMSVIFIFIYPICISYKKRK